VKGREEAQRILIEAIELYKTEFVNK